MSNKPLKFFCLPFALLYLLCNRRNMGADVEHRLSNSFERKYFEKSLGVFFELSVDCRRTPIWSVFLPWTGVEKFWTKSVQAFGCYRIRKFPDRPTDGHRDFPSVSFKGLTVTSLRWIMRLVKNSTTTNSTTTQVKLSDSCIHPFVHLWTSKWPHYRLFQITCKDFATSRFANFSSDRPRFLKAWSETQKDSRSSTLQA